MKTLFVKYIFVVCLLVSYSTSCGAQLNAEPLPLELFAKLPSVKQPKLSPDGKHILAISSLSGESAIVVAPYGGVELSTIVKLTKNKDRIEWVQWANNSRVIFYTTYPKRVFNKKTRIGRMFSVNSDGSDIRELKLNRFYRHEQADLFSDISLMAILPNDEKHVLVQTYTGKDQSPAVFKFNIYDGEVEKTVSAAEEIDTWVANREGDVHIGVRRDYDKSTKQLTTDIFYREDVTSDEWENIYSYRAFKDFYVSPIGLSDDKKSLYVFTDFEVYKDVVRRFDITKREFGEILYEVEGFDVDSAITRDGRLVGAAYTDHYYRIEYFDEELKARQKMIAQTFPKYQSYIVSNSKDKNKVIVLAMSSNSPNKYYLVDLAAKKASFWLSQYAGLENKKLKSKLNYSFKTKDGTELHGYFTEGAKGKDSPLIVLPHGGPGSRDTMDFDIWVHMLNRRGYAVLQVNFRGSTGYGNDYEAKGYRQWGKRMQSDVYEAIEWLKSIELADTDNMCMVGASYGGYVSLVAGYQKPDWFKCIVSIAGISDLPDLVESDNFYDGYKVDLKERIGDINNDDDKKDMADHSAIKNISAFKSPVLLIHGENDQSVHYSQSVDFYNALKENNKKATLLLLDDGTHYIDDPKNRQLAFEAIDTFLGKHL